MGVRSSSIKRRGRGLAALGVVVGAGLAFMAPVTSAGASSGGTLYVNATSGHDTGTCRLSSSPVPDHRVRADAGHGRLDHRGCVGLLPPAVGRQHRRDHRGTHQSGRRAVVNPTSLPASDTDTDSSQSQFAIVDVTAGCHRQAEEPHDQRGECAATSSPTVRLTTWASTTTTLRAPCRTTPSRTWSCPMTNFGCQDGLGVYVASDSGQTSNVTMTTDTVTNYDKNGSHL